MKTAKILATLAMIGTFTFTEFDIKNSGPVPFTIGMSTPAEARIGHPLTPLSYAGVARRTTRRVVRRTAIAVSVLPGGCVYGLYYGAYYYRCGGVYYAKSGPTYVQVVIE